MKKTLGRSIDQNRLMWDILSQWAQQEKRYTLEGQRLDAHDFKELTMAAFQKEVRITPGLEGGIVYLSRSTSRLTKAQMTEYLEFLVAEGTKRGIVFKHTPPDPIARNALGDIPERPIRVMLSHPTSKDERSSRFPSTTEGYMAYAQTQIKYGKGEEWFLSQEQAKLREDCKVGTLATKLLHSLIKELA